MERMILHCDLNNFYASCECIMHPEFADKPLAVCGSVEDRHGIVLAKNYHAKAFGVSTAEPVWQAKLKCPSLVIVHPNFNIYMKYSKIVKGIYTEYTDRVESFGLDECWLDISGKKITEREGLIIANEIRERIKKETGLTISVGVSFNKVFAKLGSDLKKPDAVTAITRSSFKKQIWDLPASTLLGVGRETKNFLDRYRIDTIGKIASMPVEFFEGRMGKNGVQLWKYANGEDDSPVLKTEQYIPAKSFGHGTTTPRDMTNDDMVWSTMLYLAQDIGNSLYLNNQKAAGISVAIRDSKLTHKSWRCRLPTPTDSSLNIAKAAFSLFSEAYGWENPLRSVTVTAINLIPSDSPIQMGLFDDLREFQRAEKAENCARKIRERYGRNAILPATILHKETVRYLGF